MIDPAPEAVYQSFTFAAFGIGSRIAYQLPVADGTYTLRLHFLAGTINRQFDIVLQGETALAQSTLKHLEKLAGDKANDLLWTADVARAIGRAQMADRIERQLFDQGRLHVERVPDVVARVVKAEGPETGLSLGEQAAALTLHPTLLEQLIAAANAAGKKDRATHWEKVRAEAEVAKKTLKEQDKKRAEEAKKAKQARGG